MSVILEFSIAGDEFTLGQTLSGKPDMHIELERIVPMGDAVLPFLWVTGNDFEAFEEKVRNSPHVEQIRALDRVGETALYRITWSELTMSLLEGFTEADATILEGVGDNDWVFRVRFSDHDKLTQFHNYLMDHNITIHIERTYTLSEETERGYIFDLSEAQREALVLALGRGYFATPSEINLDELADELGISRQALSIRIRQGNEKILRTTLLSSVLNYG